jgi:hypothetical protein
VSLAHDDGRGRRAEARRHVLDPLRSGFAEPAAMLAAAGADKFAGVRSACRSNGANIDAARPLAIDIAIEPSP